MVLVSLAVVLRLLGLLVLLLQVVLGLHAVLLVLLELQVPQVLLGLVVVMSRDVVCFV